MMYEGKNVNEMTEKEMELAIFDMERNSCKGCPFAEYCGKYELFYGCGVWEEAMGEDL